MGKFVAIVNFKDGEINKWKHFKVGDIYDGANHEQFLKHGFIKDAVEHAEDKAKEVEKEIAPLKSKAEEIRAKAAAYRSNLGLEPKEPKAKKQKQPEVES